MITFKIGKHVLNIVTLKNIYFEFMPILQKITYTLAYGCSGARNRIESKLRMRYTEPCQGSNLQFRSAAVGFLTHSTKAGIHNMYLFLTEEKFSQIENSQYCVAFLNP